MEFKQIVVISYIYLFVIHVILGPYWYFYISDDKPSIFFEYSVYSIIRKLLYITYISLLAFVWFLYYPTSEHFFIALLLTLIAFLGFIAFRNFSHPHYLHSIIAHSLMLIPFLFAYKHYNIKLSNIKLTKSSAIITLYIIFLIINVNKIYS